MNTIVQVSVEVQERDGVLVVDSRLIAERLGIEHESFLKTIETHKASIEEAFGSFRFEIGVKEFVRKDGQKGATQFKYALLTEEQATALMTLSRNTPQVVELKINLVRAFSEARKARNFVPAFPQSPLQILQLAVAQMTEQDAKLTNHETRLQLLEERTQKPQQGTEGLEYYTVTGWARKCGVQALTHEKALKLGRKAASLSKATGVLVSKIADAKYGQVNAYHADILKVVFSQPV